MIVVRIFSGKARRMRSLLSASFFLLSDFLKVPPNKETNTDTYIVQERESTTLVEIPHKHKIENNARKDRRLALFVRFFSKRRKNISHKGRFLWISTHPHRTNHVPRVNAASSSQKSSSAVLSFVLTFSQYRHPGFTKFITDAPEQR
jgi:hypothetical protein